MKISGLQKLTLLDFPGYTACTVFTSGCNFRCPFCHNASLVRGEGEEISEKDFFEFLEMRKGILGGVTVTGGEPTLQTDIGDFTKKISNLGYKVKLDTNGYNPQKLKELISGGNIDYIAMDIKSSRTEYGAASGIFGVKTEKIEESVNIIKESGIRYEFRTTAVKGIHTAKDFLEIGKWIGNVPRYFIQKFVDSGDILSDGYTAFSDEEMTTLLAMARVYTPNAELRGVK